MCGSLTSHLGYFTFLHCFHDKWRILEHPCKLLWFSNIFRFHRTQSIRKDAFRYHLLNVLKMSTGCSVWLDVHSELSLAWSTSHPCFIILPPLCADSSWVEIIFSLQSNFNNPVIFFSLYYSSVLNQMRGFFFPHGDLLSTLFKNESKFLSYRVELKLKKVWTPFKRQFCHWRIERISLWNSFTLRQRIKGPEESVIVTLQGTLLNNANAAAKQGGMRIWRGIVIGETSPPRWQWPSSLICPLKKVIMRKDNRQWRACKETVRDKRKKGARVEK